jgi:hypothetical protein
MQGGGANLTDRADLTDQTDREDFRRRAMPSILRIGTCYNALVTRSAAMATYEYHAIRFSDDDEKSFVGGVVVARNKEEAVAKLRSQGLKATMLEKARGLMALIKWFDADIR